MSSKNLIKAVSTFSQEWQEEVSRTVQIINDGGVIIYPTETIWGIGCDARDDEAIQRIYRIKGRDTSKKMITMIAEPKDIFQYVTNPPPDILDVLQSFDRPTSVVFADVVGISDFLLYDGTAAFRTANTAFTKALLKQSKKPLVTTSANFSAEPAPKKYENINPDLMAKVDYTVAPLVVDYEMTGTPSDILKIDARGHITQIR